MAKFLHLTEMPGLHLPWLDVTLPEPEEKVDFLALNLSQSMTFSDLKRCDDSDDGEKEDESPNAAKSKNPLLSGEKGSLNSSLPLFNFDMDDKSQVRIFL